jgi:hypothetical protein
MMNTTLIAALAPTTPEDRSAEFVPVTGGAESTSAAGLLLAAYILMWACVFGLIWLSLKKLRGLDTRMQQLEKQLDKQEAQSASHV